MYEANIMHIPAPRTVRGAVEALTAIRNACGSLPHPDDSGANIVRAGTGEPLFGYVSATYYDLLMAEVFKHLGETTYDLALLLNNETNRSGRDF